MLGLWLILCFDVMGRWLLARSLGMVVNMEYWFCTGMVMIYASSLLITH